MATRVNRQARGGPRGNDQNLGEELGLYTAVQNEIRTITRLAARAEECRQEIMDMEAEFDKKRPQKPSIKEIDELDSLIREHIKLSEDMLSIGRTGEDNTVQKLGILKAMVEHNESSQAEPPRRVATSRDASRPLELDGAADSPAPSPIGDKSHRKDRLGVSAGRGSLPPREASIKVEGADSMGGGIELNAKGKITFALGAEVAFRPKATGAEEPDWIQGTVVKVIGEGKSRRYDVQDPEPDEVTRKPGQIYRTSASSMVTIPPLGQPLGDYPRGKAVLARYPDTTTFYRAEVVGMNGTMVNLKFEGEEDERTTEVDRRFVLDHRG
ncbi:MAG: SAGA HAT/Core module component [Claussenomyces sp. TS43310]|nr:MAG: SAGA HAT/Core module component [Claussenomyces sp. TS43310]